MQSQFDELVHTHPEQEDLEFWFARDLQSPLGYARWENFQTAMSRAIQSCKTTGYDPEHHFRGVTKMVPPGSSAERPIEDFMLPRYQSSKIIGQSAPPSGSSLKTCLHGGNQVLTGPKAPKKERHALSPASRKHP
jgi:DNA-damage-inducible protein D